MQADQKLTPEEVTNLRVAWYLSKGLPQQEVADLVGKSPPAISRLVSKMTQENRWLRKTTVFAPPEELGIDEQLLMAHLCIADLGAALVEKYGQPLLACRVIPVEEQAREKPIVKQAVLIAATDRLEEIIKEGGSKPRPHLFFVGWGPTVNQIVSNLRPFKDSVRGLRLYPLLGTFSVRQNAIHTKKDFEDDKAYQHSVAYSANKNAGILASRCSQVTPRALLIPAVIAANKGQPVEGYRPVFEADMALMETFGNFWDPADRGGAIWEADTLLTSIGDADRSPAKVFCRLMGYTEPMPANLAGDIAGLAFDRAGMPLTAQDRRITGLRLEHIKAVARRFAATNPAKRCGAGVMVASSEVEKIAPLDVLLRNGFLNELIIDEFTARALLAIEG
jgi:DNA-binding transcriptional regulator LsrR (DeoR family)